MDDINFSVTVQEADYIVKTLGQRPFLEVHQLIDKLVKQANAPKLPPIDPTLLGEPNG